jgi:hypothetical protein
VKWMRSEAGGVQSCNMRVVNCRVYLEAPMMATLAMTTSEESSGPLSLVKWNSLLLPLQWPGERAATWHSTF